MTKCQLQSGCLPDDPQKTMLIRGGDFSRDGYNLGIKELHLGTFLVIQWLRLHSQCRGPGLTPGQGTRPCMPQPRPSADKFKKKKKRKRKIIPSRYWSDSFDSSSFMQSQPEVPHQASLTTPGPGP